MTLTKDEAKYLMSLVRMDVRKKERALDAAEQRENQSDDDYAAFLGKLERKIQFGRDTLNSLYWLEKG